jgi:hypothetical protein
MRLLGRLSGRYEDRGSARGAGRLASMVLRAASPAPPVGCVRGYVRRAGRAGGLRNGARGWPGLSGRTTYRVLPSPAFSLEVPRVPSCRLRRPSTSWIPRPWPFLPEAADAIHQAGSFIRDAHASRFQARGRGRARSVPGPPHGATRLTRPRRPRRAAPAGAAWPGSYQVRSPRIYPSLTRRANADGPPCVSVRNKETCRAATWLSGHCQPESRAGRCCGIRPGGTG